MEVQIKWRLVHAIEGREADEFERRADISACALGEGRRRPIAEKKSKG